MNLKKAIGTVTIVFDADNELEVQNLQKALAYEAQTKIDNIHVDDIFSVHDIPDGWAEAIRHLPGGHEASIFNIVNDSEQLNELNGLTPEVLEVIRADVRKEVKEALKPLEDFKEAFMKGFGVLQKLNNPCYHPADSVAKVNGWKQCQLCGDEVK
jgi:hypothetical protein